MARAANVLFRCLLCFLQIGPSRAAAVEPALVLESTLPLEGVRGRIDHMAVDLKRNRLIVAELGNNTVDVIEVPNGKLVRRITGVREPQGVGYAERGDLVVVANAGDGAVKFFQAGDLTPVGSVSLGDDADNVRTNSRDGTIVVGYGKGGLAIIDPATRCKIADIRLPAHPEGFQIDPNTGRAFINLPDAKQIAVVDFDTRRTLAPWRVPDANANFPMALDWSSNLLAVVFRNPARLVLFDRESGSVLSQTTACGDADDVFFDDKRRRIYISCGNGEVAIFQITGTTLEPTPPVRTASGARTSLFVPELDRLFVAKRAGLIGPGTSILVYRPES